MHAHHARKIDPVSRELEHHHTAEAVAHRRDAAIDERMRCQNVDARLGPFSKQQRIRAKACDAREDALAISGHAVAVHVARERHVAQPGEAVRALLGMRVEAGAPVDHQNPRTPVAL